MQQREIIFQLLFFYYRQLVYETFVYHVNLKASQKLVKICLQKKRTHLFCETALHAAASRGLIDIVELLLNFGKESLECKHHSGKTVLMDAVESNDTKMVDLLLTSGANITAACGRKMSKDSVNQICSAYATHKKDFCIQFTA